MNTIDRAITIRQWRKVAFGDSSYVLRAYTYGHAADIAEALGWTMATLVMGFRGTADADLKAQVIDICDEVAAGDTPTQPAAAGIATGEWGNAT